MKNRLSWFVGLVFLTALAQSWGQSPIIIREDNYLYSVDRNLRVRRHEIFLGDDGVIKLIRICHEYPPYNIVEIPIINKRGRRSWVDDRASYLTKYYELIPSLFQAKSSFTLHLKRIYTDTKQIEKFTNTVRLCKKAGIFWEDDERITTIVRGVYEEKPKKPDSKYKHPPDYIKIVQNTICSYFKGYINNRYVISLESGRIYQAENGQEMYADYLWEDVGWATMENWSGLRSSNQIISLTNLYILKTIIRTPIYYPVIFGLSTGNW